MFELNYKKLISVFLSLAMLISSVFITGIVAQAADLDSLFGTTNTYDHDRIEFKTNSYDGHPASSVVVNGEEVMASSTKPLYFSAYGVSVEAVPNELGADRGNALHFIDARSPSVYYYAKARIYKDDTEKLTQYKPNADTTYEIKFKYNVVGMTVSSFKFQVRQVAYQEIEYYNSNKDLGKEVEICTITEPTNGWVDAYATFTTSADTQQYMALGVVSGSEDAVNGIDVWVDDVVVSECVNVTAHNYDTAADKAIPVSKNTTIADIQIPDVAGYRFCGIYADAQYSTKLDTSVKAGLYTDLYFKWEPLVLGQYYCGFEDYKPQAVAMSYDADVVAIGGEATYVGSKALKATLNAKGLTAFELRNDKAFEIVKKTVYTLTFAYKASADVEIYAGVGKAGDVPNTAEALDGTKLTGDSTWKIATINVTPDKGTAEGYAITMLVFADTAAEVFVDDVLVAGPEQGYENPSINTNFDNSWYPGLALFEGIEMPEQIVYWDGSTEAPVYNETDGVYEISKPSQLAYVIYSGGGAGNTYKLLKDIYLNDTDKIDWANGTVAEGYTAQQWYKSSNWTWNTEGGKTNGAATNFQGTIDGNNHTVYGLYFTNPSSTYQSASWYGTGLIPRAANGGTTSIKNLGLDCVYIDSTYGAGGFVGVLGADGTATLNIDNCFIGENASITGYRAAAFRGYESGSTTTVSNCYSLAKVNYQAYGGLLTTTDYATISNTYIANGTIANYGSSWKGSITNCYQTIASNGVTQTGITTVADPANMKGTDVFTNAAKMPNLNSSNAYVATEGYPVLKSFQDEVINDTEDTEEDTTIEVWKGKEDLSEPVDSDSDGVYEITNGAELAYAISTGGGFNYILTKDVYLNEIDKINWSTGAVATDYSANGWYSAYSTPFTGNIDGNGHTVYGMRYTTDSAYAAGNDYAIGLIPRIAENTQVTIKNLAVDKSFMKYSHHAAAIVGIVGANSTVNIEGCYVGADTTMVGYNASAFRGAAGSGSTTNISKCYSLADINANGGNYGLVGSWGWTNISYSYNSNGPITSSSETYKVSLSNCYQSVNGGNNTGVTTITDAKNMKGEDVLSNSSKMSGLASANAFVPTYLNFAGHDYYIYLPAGTVFAKDLQPSFFDTFFIGVDTEAVLLGNTMVTGAYVKFGVEPTAEDIKVPTSLANFVHQGTMAEIKAMDYQTKYFGIQSEIIKQELDKQSADAVNYIFITDLHYDGNKTADYSVALFNQMDLVVDMANTDDSIDFIAIGGDIIEGTTTGENAINLIQTILEPLKNSIKPVLVMIGNHDDNSYGSWSAYIGESNFNAGKSDDSYFAADKLISKYQWDEGIIKEFVHKDIVQPSIDGVPQRYYYYDLVKNGKTTRIYVLDCIDYEVGSYNDDGTINELVLDDGKTAADEENVPASGTDLQYKYKMGASEMTYSDTQIEWLESTLIAGGYDDVIFLSHAGIDKETMGVSTNGDKLRALISDFNNKTGKLAETSGKIMSYQFGHVHAERELYSADINLWQICSGNATPQAIQNTGIQTTPWRDHAYSMGTETEAQFDVMSVTESGIVKLGIGGASDQKLTSYLTFTTGDVNTDETVDICDLVKLNLVANGANNKIASVDVNKDKAFIFAVDAEALRELIIRAE